MFVIEIHAKAVARAESLLTCSRAVCVATNSRFCFTHKFTHCSKHFNYTSTPPMGRTARSEPKCLYAL